MPPKPKAPLNKPAKKPVKKCDLEKICAYLDELDIYLKKLTADYKKTKIAVCNLDLAEFGSGGDLNKRLCVGLPTGEPADPPPPPLW